MSIFNTIFDLVVILKHFTFKDPQLDINLLFILGMQQIQKINT